MTRIALIGAAGRMGREIARAIDACDDITVSAGVEPPGHPSIGTRCGDGAISDCLDKAVAGTDVIVDFSTPEGIEVRLSSALTESKPYVSGVTGLTDSARRAMRDAGSSIPVVSAPNFAIGINTLYRLVTEAVRLLGPKFDAEILETHHRAKEDAPSGTARMLLEVLKSTDPTMTTVSGREGSVGPKPPREVGVHSVRTGHVVGEHTVVFGGPGERLELTHRAASREAFAIGVVSAVRFVSVCGPGYYSMTDVLGSPSDSD